MRGLSLLMMCAAASAAEPTFLRDWALTRGFNLGRPVRATPTPDGKSVLFLRATARDPAQSLFALDVASGETRELLTPAQLLKGAAEKLSPEEKARRERQRITARGFTSFQLSDDGKLLLVSLSGHLYSVRGAEVGELPIAPPVIDPQLSPDGKKVAYVRDRDLWVLEFGKKERRLTKSDAPTLTNGVAEFVAQEEMSRFSGFWWSGDSQRLAYEQADAREVETLHVFDTAHPEAAGDPTFYPRPGKKNVKARLGIISLAGGATTWIPWDTEKFPYLVRVEWKDRAPLSFAVMGRDQHDLQLFAVDGVKPRLLLSEHDDAWIDLDATLPRWLPDGSGFLWSSEREGGWRLELRDQKGARVRPLGELADNYDSLVDVDPVKRLARFVGGPDPTSLQLFEVSLDGGAARLLTPEPGLHDVRYSRDHQTWVDRAITEHALARATVHGADGKTHELPSVAESPPFWDKTEIVRAGKEQFICAITRPRDFDPKKKYPVLVSVYGGPSAQIVERRPELFRQWMADHGIVVVAIEGRGTPRRGRAWSRHIVGNFTRTLDDQVTGLRALAATHPELDLSRVGIYGWSFGGYLSALAVLARPDVFHVAVAGAPVVDWQDYDTFYTERYLGLPDANAEGYKQSSLLTWANKLSRPLLLVHGTSDDNVYFFHTLKLCDALFRAGRPYSLLPLIGLTHMVPDPVVTEQLWTRIANHVLATLKP